MEIRELNENELRSRGRPQGAVAKIRAVHHLVAQLYAKKVKIVDIAAAVNRTPATIRNWINSPANEELVAQYEEAEDEAITTEAEYTLALKRRIRTLADEELLARIEEDAAQFSIRELTALGADTSDRTGYGKQSVQVNVNLDLKARMEQAKKKLEGLAEAEAEGKVIEFVRKGR
jgi:hypothetical protein